MFERHINSQLEKWKKKPSRKPLVLRGARQVGKTTLVKEFAKSYLHSIVLNLERPSDIRYFKQFDDAKTIVNALFATYSISFDQAKNTLLFIDEIQESPEAIAMLRYFYEDVPQLHIIAAGSLLEHVMQDVKSFPVGRVEYLYLHPLNFDEYLQAKNHKGALEQLNKTPVEPYAHLLLLEQFHQYAIIGGMPEIVAAYIKTESLADLTEIYESIWSTYKNDVEKYASNTTEARVIRHIMDTAHLYLDQRIKFQNFGNSNYRSREVGEAIRNLDGAGVIQLIYPTTQTEPPIRPDKKKSPRLQFLDTGLVNYDLKIQAELLGVKDMSNAAKGALIPHLTTQQVISLNILTHKKPNFWVRQKTQSSSEVDLIMSYKDKIIPIEIKSGTTGTLRSLHQFIEQCPHNYAVRLYGGTFGIEEHQTPNKRKPYKLMNLPYYLASKLPEYIAYFIDG